MLIISQEVETLIYWVLCVHKLLLDGLSGQFWQFVGCLQATGNFDRSLPIIVVIALLISESDQILLRNFRCIISHHIMSRRACSLGYFLCHQVEIEPIIHWQFLDNYASGIWIVQFTSVGGEKPRINFFINYDINDLWIVVGLLCLLLNIINWIVEYLYLMCKHRFKQRVSHWLSVKEQSIR